MAQNCGPFQVGSPNDDSAFLTSQQLKALYSDEGETHLNHQCVAPTWLMQRQPFCSRTLTAHHLSHTLVEERRTGRMCLSLFLKVCLCFRSPKKTGPSSAPCVTRTAAPSISLLCTSDRYEHTRTRIHTHTHTHTHTHPAG